MKKPLVLLWKIVKKSKNHYKTCGFLKKRVVKPISNYGFGPWVSHTRLDKLWGTLTDKLFREPLVLLCFRSKMLENHWFYCVFAHKCSKTIGFIVFSWLCRSKTLENHWFYCVFAQKCSKTIGFIVFSWLFHSKMLKNHWFYSVFLTFQAKKWKNHWFYCEKF